MYTAPEAHKIEGVYQESHKAIDVYSLGILLIEIFGAGLDEETFSYVFKLLSYECAHERTLYTYDEVFRKYPLVAPSANQLRETHFHGGSIDAATLRAAILRKM